MGGAWIDQLKAVVIPNTVYLGLVKTLSTRTVYKLEKRTCTCKLLQDWERKKGRERERERERGGREGGREGERQKRKSQTDRERRAAQSGI